MLMTAALMGAAAFFAGTSAVAASQGEDPVGELTGRISTSAVSFDYSYVMERDGLNVRGSGSINLQDNSYYIEGDGLRIWCDGSSVWTMDVFANEVVIEPSDEANGFTADPILILKDCDRDYTWDKEGVAAKFGGAPCRMYSLTPKDYAEFTAIKLYLSGSRLVGASLGSEGMTITFTISSFAFGPYDSAADFSPESFPDDCVVTDLR